MKRSEISALAKAFVELSLRVATRGGVSAADRAKLHTAGEHMLRAVAQWTPTTSQAVIARKALAQARSDAEPFTITFRATGEVEQVTGWSTLAKRLGYGVGSVRNFMSRGKGRHAMTLVNRKTGEGDSVIVQRVNPAVNKGGRPKREVNDN